MTSKLRALIHRVQQSSLATDGAIELVYTPHDRWPTKPGTTDKVGRPLQLSVLDSSFNPPTLAHLALINTHIPPEFSHSGQRDYDAKLLLLSVRNADKVLKPGDATFEQRIEMMTLLTKDVVTRHQNEATPGANVAVAIINEPTFVGKSKMLQAFLRSRLSGMRDATASETQLTFLMGLDTLERLFSPRYYVGLSDMPAEENMLCALRTFLSASPANGDNSRIICATRPVPTEQPGAEQPVTLDETQGSALAASQSLHSASEFLNSSPKRIVITDIDANVKAYSSSEVRKLVAESNLRWKSMVTGSIADFVEKERLYRHEAAV